MLLQRGNSHGSCRAGCLRQLLLPWAVILALTHPGCLALDAAIVTLLCALTCSCRKSGQAGLPLPFRLPRLPVHNKQVVSAGLPAAAAIPPSVGVPPTGFVDLGPGAADALLAPSPAPFPAATSLGPAPGAVGCAVRLCASVGLGCSRLHAWSAADSGARQTRFWACEGRCWPLPGGPLCLSMCVLACPQACRQLQPCRPLSACLPLAWWTWAPPTWMRCWVQPHPPPWHLCRALLPLWYARMILAHQLRLLSLVEVHRGPALRDASVQQHCCTITSRACRRRQAAAHR